MPRGGKRAGAGRPQGSGTVAADQKVCKAVTIRCTEGQEREIKRRAADAGKSISRYILTALQIE